MGKASSSPSSGSSYRIRLRYGALEVFENGRSNQWSNATDPKKAGGLYNGYIPVGTYQHTYLDTYLPYLITYCTLPRWL